MLPDEEAVKKGGKKQQIHGVSANPKFNEWRPRFNNGLAGVLSCR
jgi:hypothetical protein